MFCWEVQTIWRNRQLKRQLSRRKKKEKFEAEAFDTNPLIESTKTNKLLNESDFRNAVPPSIIENTTRSLGEKVERKPS
jgi:hypothetical protein